MKKYVKKRRRKIISIQRVVDRIVFGGDVVLRVLCVDRDSASKAGDSIHNVLLSVFRHVYSFFVRGLRL